MADHAVTYTVTVDAATAERLDAAAREAGVAPEAYAGELIADSVDGGNWSYQTESARRFQHEQALLALAEYDRTGISIPAEEAFARFDLALEKALAAKR